jgi:hypothetical protein
MKGPIGVNSQFWILGVGKAIFLIQTGSVNVNAGDGALARVKLKRNNSENNFLFRV